VTQKSANSLHIQNVRAIENLHIPIPDEGGVVVLQGYHGTGKSTALLAVDMVAGRGPAKLEKHDGSLRGEVVGLGVTIKMDKTTRREGECPFQQLDGASIARLVNPGIKDLKAADADRTKGLLEITGASITVADFKDCGLDQPEIISATKGTDGAPVAAVQGVKEALNAKALKLEKEAAELTGEHDAISKRLNEAGVGSEAELRTDAEIDKDLEDCRAKIRVAETDKKWVDENRAAYEEAKGAADSDETVESVQDRITELGDRIKAGTAKIDALTEERNLKLAEISKEYAAKIKLAEDAQDELIAEKRAESARLEVVQQNVAAAASRKSLLAMFESRMTTDNQGVIDGERAKEETLLKERTDNAAARVRLADAKLQKEIVAKIKAAQEGAKALREKAKGVEKLLGKIIPETSPIKFDESGRLVVKTDRADQEYFTELSDGERWGLAIDIAVSTMKTGGIMTIPQTAWQELAPTVQAEIAAKCRERKVTAVTAAITDDPAIVPKVM
jgi:hypothetical protein